MKDQQLISNFLEQFLEFEKKGYKVRKHIINDQMKTLIDSLSGLEYKDYQTLFDFEGDKYLNRLIFYQIAERNVNKLSHKDVIEFHQKEYDTYKAENLGDEKFLGNYSGMPLNYSLRLLVAVVKNNSSISKDDILDIHSKSKVALSLFQKFSDLDPGGDLKEKYETIRNISDNRLKPNIGFGKKTLNRIIDLLFRRRGLVGILSILVVFFVGELAAISSGEEVVELCDKIIESNPNNWKYYFAYLFKIFFGKGSWAVLGITAIAITGISYLLVRMKNMATS